MEGLLERAEPEAEQGLSLESSDGEADPMYDQAVNVVLKTRRPSISLVQRHLRIGYNRAARLIEQMERAGMVSPMQTNGNREVLVPAGEGEAAGGPRGSGRSVRRWGWGFLFWARPRAPASPNSGGSLAGPGR